VQLQLQREKLLPPGCNLYGGDTGGDRLLWSGKQSRSIESATKNSGIARHCSERRCNKSSRHGHAQCRSPTTLRGSFRLPIEAVQPDEKHFNAERRLSKNRRKQLRWNNKFNRVLPLVSSVLGGVTQHDLR
jgi:hypothetical protein